MQGFSANRPVRETPVIQSRRRKCELLNLLDSFVRHCRSHALLRVRGARMGILPSKLQGRLLAASLFSDVGEVSCGAAPAPPPSRRCRPRCRSDRVRRRGRAPSLRPHAPGSRGPWVAGYPPRPAPGSAQYRCSPDCGLRRTQGEGVDVRPSYSVKPRDRGFVPGRTARAGAGPVWNWNTTAALSAS